MPSGKATALLAASLPLAIAASFLGASAEWAIYDARLGMRHDGGWPADLVLVPLDESAIAALGGWPLSAAATASLLDALHAAGAKTVVLDVFLGAAGDVSDQSRLAPSLAHTVTAVTFDPGDGRQPSADELRAALIPPSAGPFVGAKDLSFPPETIAASVARLGHAGFAEDGPVRASPPLVRVRDFDGALPSQPLAALIEHRGLDPAAIVATARTFALPGRAPISLVRGATLLDLVPGKPGPREIAPSALLAGTVAPGSLAGALAIVHVDTPEDRHASPLGAATPGGMLLASAIRTLDGGRSPHLFSSWAAIALCAAGAYATTRLRGRRVTRLIACSALEGAWLTAAFALVPAGDVFLPLVGPLVVFACALGAIAIRENNALISGSANGSDVPIERS